MSGLPVDNIKVYLEAETEDELMPLMRAYNNARAKFFDYGDPRLASNGKYRTYFYDDFEVWFSVIKKGEERRHE